MDDEELVRAGTADMLRDLGHEVIEAFSGTQALEVLRSDSWVDAVVTDQMMPGLKGADPAREIQARQPDLPVILISGYTSLSEAKVRGVPLLHKPFRQVDLATRLTVLLAGQGKVVSLSDRRSRHSSAE